MSIMFCRMLSKSMSSFMPFPNLFKVFCNNRLSFILLSSFFAPANISFADTGSIASDTLEQHDVNDVTSEGFEYNIEGHNYVSDDTILNIIVELKKNNMLTLYNLIVSLYDLGVFKSIKVDGRNIILNEHPFFSDIEVYIDGKQMFVDDDQAKAHKKLMIKELNIRTNYPVHPTKIYYFIELVKQSLLSQMVLSNIFVDCEIIANKDKDGQKSLKINLFTESKSARSKIVFKGNHSFRSDDLKMILPTKNKAICWNLMKVTSVSDDISVYKDALEKHYQDHGFFDMKVESINRLQQNGCIVYQVNISEGNRYKIGSVSIQNHSDVNLSDLYPMLNLRKGSFFNQRYVNDFNKLVIIKLFARGICNIQVGIEHKKSDSHTDIVVHINECRDSYLTDIKMNSTYISHAHMRRMLGLSNDVPVFINDDFLNMCVSRLIYSGLYDDISKNHKISPANATKADINFDVQDYRVKLLASPSITLGGGATTFNCGFMLNNLGPKRNYTLLTDLQSIWPRISVSFSLSKQLSLFKDVMSSVDFIASFTRNDDFLNSAYCNYSSMDGYKPKTVFDNITKHHKNYILFDRNLKTIELERSVIDKAEDKLNFARLTRCVSVRSLGFAARLNLQGLRYVVSPQIGVDFVSVKAGDYKDKKRFKFFSNTSISKYIVREYETYDTTKVRNYTKQFVDDKHRYFNKETGRFVLKNADLTDLEKSKLGTNPAPGTVVLRGNGYEYDPDYLKDCVNDFVRINLNIPLKYLLMRVNDFNLYITSGIDGGLASKNRSYINLFCGLNASNKIGHFIISGNVIYKRSFNKCILDNIPSDFLSHCNIGPVDIANGLYLGGKNAFRSNFEVEYDLFKNHLIHSALMFELGCGYLSDAGVKQMKLHPEMCDRRNLLHDSLRIANSGKLCTYYAFGTKFKILNSFSLKIGLAFPFNHDQNVLNQVSRLRFGFGA